MTVTDDPFAFWTQQLEELTAAEKNEVELIVGRARRGVNVNAYCAALAMRYNFNRVDLILKAVRQRLRSGV